MNEAKNERADDPLSFARSLVEISTLEEDQQAEVLQSAYERACAIIGGYQFASVVQPYDGESPASVEVATRSILVFYGLPTELIL